VEYAQRLIGAANTVEQAIRTGADAADQATWLPYWQLQVAKLRGTSSTVRPAVRPMQASSLRTGRQTRS
jgi:hypothetical protein